MLDQYFSSGLAHLCREIRIRRRANIARARLHYAIIFECGADGIEASWRERRNHHCIFGVMRMLGAVLRLVALNPPRFPRKSGCCAVYRIYHRINTFQQLDRMRTHYAGIYQLTLLEAAESAVVFAEFLHRHLEAPDLVSPIIQLEFGDKRLYSGIAPRRLLYHPFHLATLIAIIFFQLLNLRLPISDPNQHLFIIGALGRYSALFNLAIVFGGTNGFVGHRVVAGERTRNRMFHIKSIAFEQIGDLDLLSGIKADSLLLLPQQITVDRILGNRFAIFGYFRFRHFPQHLALLIPALDCSAGRIVVDCPRQLNAYGGALVDFSMISQEVHQPAQGGHRALHQRIADHSQLYFGNAWSCQFHYLPLVVLVSSLRTIRAGTVDI